MPLLSELQPDHQPVTFQIQVVTFIFEIYFEYLVRHNVIGPSPIDLEPVDFFEVYLLASYLASHWPIC